MQQHQQQQQPNVSDSWLLRSAGRGVGGGIHCDVAAAVVGRKIIPNHDYVSQENEEKAQDPFQRSPMTLCRVKFRSVISNVQS